MPNDYDFVFVSSLDSAKWIPANLDTFYHPKMHNNQHTHIHTRNQRITLFLFIYLFYVNVRKFYIIFQWVFYVLMIQRKLSNAKIIAKIVVEKGVKFPHYLW